MNVHSTLVDALKATGLLAAEIAILVLIAAAVEPLVKSAVWRRTLWQVCILTITLIAVMELSGATRALMIKEPPHENKTRLIPAPESKPEFQVTSLLFRPAIGQQPRAIELSRPTSLIEKVAPWIAFAWVLVSGVLLCRLVISRIVLCLLHYRSRPIQSTPLLQELAVKLGIRGHITVIECARLRTPVAFGFLSKVIGLPRGFVADYTQTQQAVILAHELAHLAAHDSQWCLLADFARALLWWHPAVWFARQRLQQRIESAADEASLLIENGPSVLAECLVNFGRRLQTPGSLGWMQIEGFRSRLAHRVENLLKRPGTSWKPVSRCRALVVKMFVPAALVVATILCSGWISPPPSTQDKNMNHTIWKRSLPAFALLALLNADHQLAAADKTNQPGAKVTAADPKPAGFTAKPQPARSPGAAQKRRGVGAVRRKLDQIVFDTMQADNLPLGAVIQMLIDQSQKRDTDRVGVNFLLANPGAPSRSIDPSTGLPVQSSSEPLDLSAVTIRIMPPLRNVRLIDVLEAMIRVADTAITYSIEEYGVVFSVGSGSGGGQKLETRTFAMSEPQNFFKGIESAFGINVAGKDGIPSPKVQQEIFEELFGQLGLDWGTPKSAFYNGLTGVVMVRAAPEDMPVILAAMQTLGGTQIGSSADSPSLSAAK